MIKFYHRKGGIDGIFVLIIWYIGNFIYYKIKIPIIEKILFFLWYIIYQIFEKALLHAEIQAQVKIGKNLWLPHGCNGIVINKNCIIGDNVIILHQVTLGIKFNGDKSDGAPIIGNNVLIGAGAKVLGKIKIGDNVVIGANSVITKDVPNDSIVIGNPAKIIPKGEYKEKGVLYGN